MKMAGAGFLFGVIGATLPAPVHAGDFTVPITLAQATPELRSHVTTTRWFTADVIDMSLELLVLVNFWSASCTSCRAFAEQLERVVRSTRLDVRVVFVDIDANPELAYEYDARSAPVTLAFQDGMMVGRFRGTAPDSELEEFVNSPSPLS